MFFNNAKIDAIELLKNTEAEYNSLGESANDYALKLFQTRKSAVKAIDRIEAFKGQELLLGALLQGVLLQP